MYVLLRRMFLDSLKKKAKKRRSFICENDKIQTSHLKYNFSCINVFLIFATARNGSHSSVG